MKKKKIYFLKIFLNFEVINSLVRDSENNLFGISFAIIFFNFHL